METVDQKSSNGCNEELISKGSKRKIGQESLARDRSTVNNLVRESGVLSILADVTGKVDDFKIGTKILKIKGEGDPKTQTLFIRKLQGKFENIQEEYLDIDMDNLIEFIGTEGKYQYSLIILVSIMSIVMSMVQYSTSYVLADPDFKCDGKDCSETAFCTMYPNEADWVEPNIDWKYDSWVKRYLVICGDGGNRDIYRQFIMISSALIYFFATIVSDVAGRMFAFKLFSIIILPFALIGVWVDDITFKVVVLGIFTAEEAILTGLFAIIINESLSSDSKLRSKAIAIYFCMFSMGGIVLSQITYKVKNSDTLQLIMSIGSILSIIPCFALIYEPPKQLYKRGKVSQLFRTLKKIAHFNGKKELTMMEIQSEAGLSQIDQEKTLCTLEVKTTLGEKCKLIGEELKLLFASKLFFNLLGFFMICWTIWICYNGITFNSGQIGLSSIQYDVIMLASIEAFGYIICTIFVHKVKRKNQMIICYLIMLVGAAVLIALAIAPQFKNDNLVQAQIVVIFVKGGMSVLYVVLYQYGTELFPTRVRGTANGICITSAKFMSFVSSNLISLSKNTLHVNPMVGCAATCLFALPAFIWLPETFEQKME